MSAYSVRWRTPLPHLRQMNTPIFRLPISYLEKKDAIVSPIILQDSYRQLYFFWSQVWKPEPIYSSCQLFRKLHAVYCMVVHRTYLLHQWWISHVIIRSSHHFKMYKDILNTHKYSCHERWNASTFASKAINVQRTQKHA